MKKLFLFLLLALLVSVCAAADYSQGAEIINGTVIEATPTLDGVLDDAYLDSLCVKLNPPSYVGAETDVFATVYSLYDDGFVYVFFNVENDTTLTSADPSYIARDSHPSLNDAVEVRIGDNGAGKLPEYTGTNNHHLIIADPFELRCSAYKSTLGNRTALLSSASKITSETSYTVELRIPLKAPLEESDVLQFNFQVDDLQDADGTTGYVGLSSSYSELNSFSVDASTHYPTVAPTVSHVEFTPPIHNQRFLFSRPNSTTGMSFIVHYLDGTSVDVTDEVVLDKTEFTSVGYTLVNAVWKDLKAPFLAEVHYARGYEAGYTWQVYSHGTLYVTGEIPNFTEAAPSPWSEYSEYITSLLPAPEVTVIGDRAFAECYNLEKARIPDSVAYIGADAFADCPRLVIYADKNTVAREYALKNNLVTSLRLNGANPSAIITSNTVMKGTPTLDGTLDDAYLDSARVRLRPPAYEGADTDVEADVWTLFDDEYVWVFFKVENDKTLMSADDGYIAGDPHPSFNDAVEVRIGDNGAGKLPFETDTEDTHLLFIADAYGKRFSNYKNIIGDYSDKAESVSKIISDTSYCVEMKLPLLKAFEKGDSITMNFQVDDLQNDEGDTGYIGLGGGYPILVDFELGFDVASGTIDTINWVVSAEGVLTVSGEGAIPAYTKSANAPWTAYAKNITKIVVSDGVTEIGAYAFYNLTKATTIEVADSVEKVGQLFLRDSGITEIALPGVKTVALNAFGSATELATVIFSENAVDFKGNIFNNQTVTVKAPESSYADKYVELYADRYSGSVTFESDGTTASNPVVRFAFAGDSVFFAIFENAKGNWALEISGQGKMKNFPYVCQKNIDKGFTFSPMYYIGEVEDKIDGVEPEAKILSIKVAEGITTIGNYIFYKCTKATALTLPEGITSIGQGAFRNCQRLKTITLPESVTKIEKTAFVSCKTLTELYIPEGVTVVGSGIFEKCDKIDSLVVKTKSAEAIAVISAEYPTVTIVSDF